MRLGMDTYSLRWQGWDAVQTLEYAAKVGLDNVHFSERQNLASHEEGYLKSLKNKAEELGLNIEIGFMSFDKYSGNFNPQWGSGEQQLTEMARAAKTVGSPVVRCLLGSFNDRLGEMPIEAHIEECVRTLKSAAPVARDLGIKFAIENHGGVDLLAREIKMLIEEVGTDVVGSCLDTGNPAWGGENPVVSAEILAPYVISSHFRDNRAWAVEEGAMVQWVPAGRGNTDLKRIVEILKEKAPQAPIDLEIITAIPPKLIAYNDPDSTFWKAYPQMLAKDFVRFTDWVNKAEVKEPIEQVMVKPGTRVLPEGPEGDTLRTQQREHFEESIRYCRDVLGIGERGR